MDFFKSVFSDNPEELSDSETTPTSSPKSQSQPQPPNPSSPSTSNPYPSPNVSAITNAWTFGSSLFKTLASKSESVIDTYRRDLGEFSSGLKKETAVIRQAATRAVKDLPTSLEAGAAAAQESLESVGHAIDNLTEIIAHGKESLLANDSDSEYSDTEQITGNQYDSNSKPYSRLEAQIRAIQCDLNTYCKEVDELDEYNEWKLGFVLDERGEEIADLIEENGAIEDIYTEIVPSKVDHKTFFERYFFRVYKVRKAEEARAKLVKRAILGEVEEELSWDVDDDDYEERDSEQEDEEKDNVEKSEVDTEEKGLKIGNEDEGGVSESKSDNVVDQEGRLDEPESSGDKVGVKSDERITSEGKTDSDISVISSQLSPEEDLSWDEIEDIGSSDEHNVAAPGSPSRADLHKRLSAAEEEEDLTWDIEDDVEPVKS